MNRYEQYHRQQAQVRTRPTEASARGVHSPPQQRNPQGRGGEGHHHRPRPTGGRGGGIPWGGGRRGGVAALHQYIYIYIYISVSLSLSIYLSIYLSTYLPIYLSIYLSIYVCVCVRVCGCCFGVSSFCRDARHITHSQWVPFF